MEETLKIIIVGDSTVGKTSFVQRYVNNVFSPLHKTTLGVDFFLKKISWSEELSLNLQLWDIAGQDRFTIMTRVYYQQAHACILIFDVTQPSSFRNLFKWKKNLDENCHLKDGSVVPSMVLANKCDLEDKRQVEASEVDLFCKENEITAGWQEISVKENIMVQESIMNLLEVLVPRLEKGGEVLSSSDFQTINLSETSKPTEPKEKESKCSC